MSSPAVRNTVVEDSYSTLIFKEIRVENHPQDSPVVTPIQVVKLYRPDRRNAFTERMTDELEHVFQLLDMDQRVKCVVVTGHGDVFCAGADLETMFRKSDEKVNEHRDSGGRAALAIHQCRKPVIGALNGAAVGIGITLTLPMAIRLATRDAKIGFAFGRRGLVMEAASSYFLPRLIGMSRAMHLITTGSTYPASHQLLSGLFSETLQNASDVLPRALSIAQDFVDNCSNVSWLLNRELMWRNPGTAEGTHLLDSRIIYELFGSVDNTEGVKSFLEKRKAMFKGTVESDVPQTYPWWQPIDLARRYKGPIVDAKL
ncbi:ClpP/crotonase-like domain-containing protein [Dactylonectria estremocensis]|uniref:ClpP/crotonase-like domain-containing protein n=1 Tax=Dactylonectria estremocensis TaxID=1079267 RepID=A0A9P9IDV3_9HYPO|nr:ClpP/crotonase-like domain-containing protein [Dactylonectria estremocensis]